MTKDWFWWQCLILNIFFLLEYFQYVLKQSRNFPRAGSARLQVIKQTYSVGSPPERVNIPNSVRDWVIYTLFWEMFPNTGGGVINSRLFGKTVGERTDNTCIITLNDTCIISLNKAITETLTFSFLTMMLLLDHRFVHHYVKCSRGTRPSYLQGGEKKTLNVELFLMCTQDFRKPAHLYTVDSWSSELVGKYVIYFPR
jgi:hypothetical protein